MAMKERELKDEQATELPDREAMSIIAVGDNVAAPVNEANALNFYSDGAVAVADADQYVYVEQTDLDPDTTAEAAPTEEPTAGEETDDDLSPRRGERGGRTI